MWQFIVKTFQDSSSRQFKIFHDILAVIILTSICLIALETVPVTAEKYRNFFWYADIFITSFFAIEYILRIGTSKKPLKYIFSGMGIIDFVAIAPSFVLFGMPNASQTIRLLRVIRLVRVLRLLRVVRLVRFFGKGKKKEDRMEKAEELLPFVNLEIYFFALTIVVTFSASLMYLFERKIPETVFKTIPDGMWWAITTVTTVGYGDMVPETVGGKMVAATTMLSGFALLALLLSVVGPALQVFLFGSELGKDKTPR
jgi:voltage-gated potassium channel